MPVGATADAEVLQFEHIITVTLAALSMAADLSAPPAGDALALDRDGNALVGLQDGSVVCVGGGE